MTQTSTDQKTEIANAVAQSSTLVTQLRAALNQAGQENRDDIVQALLPKLQEAIDLQAAAVNLQTIATVEALKPAASNFQTTANKLKAETAQIDKAVKIVGTVATVLSTISQIATTAASLFAKL